jgi:hypothetical protein
MEIRNPYFIGGFGFYLVPVEVTRINLNKANSLLKDSKLFAISILGLTYKSLYYVTIDKFRPQLPNKLPNEF